MLLSFATYLARSLRGQAAAAVPSIGHRTNAITLRRLITGRERMAKNDNQLRILDERLKRAEDILDYCGITDPDQIYSMKKSLTEGKSIYHCS